MSYVVKKMHERPMVAINASENLLFRVNTRLVEGLLGITLSRDLLHSIDQHLDAVEKTEPKTIAAHNSVSWRFLVLKIHQILAQLVHEYATEKDGQQYAPPHIALIETVALINLLDSPCHAEIWVGDLPTNPNMIPLVEIPSQLMLGDLANDILFVLRDDCWTSLFDLDNPGLLEMDDPKFKSSRLVQLDNGVISLAVTSNGRFDAYIQALLAYVICNPGEVENSEEIQSNSKWMSKLFHGAMRLLCVHGLRIYGEGLRSYDLSQAKYEWYVTLLSSGSLTAVQDTFHDIANEVWHAQFTKGNVESSTRLERLLVALIGHENDLVRSQAIVFLNNLYDGHEWQQDFPFLPIVRCVSDNFELVVRINHDADPDRGEFPRDVFVCVSMPAAAGSYEIYMRRRLHWSIEDDGSKYRRFISERSGRGHTWIGHANFGKFHRCGFYDWRIVQFDSENGSWDVVESSILDLKRHFETSYSFLDIDDNNSNPFRSKNLWPELGRLADATNTQNNPDNMCRTLPLQGRFIVHPKELRNIQLHEIMVDQFGARMDENTGDFIERGSFSLIGASLEEKKKQGISAIVLTGALARDNGESTYTSRGEQIYERPDSSPFAVTCRASPCEIVGGVSGFHCLMNEANRIDMKILVETLSRVASSRPHRKYNPHVLHTIDHTGKKMLLYGTDGRSLSFEESCQLNYRKLDVWDLLARDITAWPIRMNVHGVRIDHAHILPHIMKSDHIELNRFDPDGTHHYTPEQRLLGEVVLPLNEEGFWTSSAADSHWPNPLFIRICKHIWREHTNFIIVGDCGGALETTKRIGILSR